MAPLYPSASFSANSFVASTDKIYFKVSNGAEYLAMTDGTAGGTVVTDKPVSNLMAIDNKLFYARYNSGELWVTDGINFTLLRTFNDIPLNFTNFGQKLYFTASSTVNPGLRTVNALWVSDGTISGTNYVVDPAPNIGSIATTGFNNLESTSSSHGPDVGVVWNITVAMNKMYLARAWGSNCGVWVTDGTSSGHYFLQLDQITSDQCGIVFGSYGHIGYVYNGGNYVYFFTGQQNVPGSKLWKNDGTPGGTTLVKEFTDDILLGDSPYGNLSLNGNLFLKIPNRIVRTDGTTLGTGAIADNSSGSFLSSIGTDILYSGFPPNGIFKVASTDKFAQKITFNTLSSKTFGAPPFELSATSTSGLPVFFTSSNPSVATVNGTTVTIVGAGTTTITASQAGDATFAAAPVVERSLVVNKASQTITFNALSNVIVSSPPFNLPATATSGLPISFTSSNTNVATITGSTVTIHGIGATTIVASQPGNVNYNAALNVNQTLTVIEAPVYCTPAHNSPNCNADHAYIETVKLDYNKIVAFQKSGSGCPLNSSGVTGYSDYTSLHGSVKPGTTYNGTVINNAGGCLYTSVFIDYNIDGDFDDAGEMVFQSINAPCGDGQQNKFSFLVPMSATAGPTRMRVRSVGDGEGIVSNACTDYYFGETEDYTIIIDPALELKQVISNTTLNTCSAQLLDNGGEGNYAVDQNVTMTLTPATAGKKVKISFSEFDLEQDYDFLKIYDGPNTSSPLVATLTGNSLPTDIVASGSGGELTLWFTSDESINGSGWVANISCAKANQIIFPGRATYPRFKGEVFSPSSSASSGLPVSYTIGTNAQLVSSSTVKGLTAGVATIIVSQAGNEIYNPIQIPINFTVLEDLSPYVFLDQKTVSQPYGIALTATNIYVTSHNLSEVRVYDLAGNFVSSVGSPGTGNGQLTNPSGIAVDNAGNLYVTENQDNGRVSVFDNTGAFVRHIGSGSLSWPEGIALTPAGNVLIAASGVVFEYQPDGTFVSSFGETELGSPWSPWGIATDGTGNIYIADFDNKKIQIFNSSYVFQRSIGSAGSGPGQLKGPSGIKVDASGRIFVLDVVNRNLQVFANDGTYLFTEGSADTGIGDPGYGHFNYPYDLAINSTGSIMLVTSIVSNLVQSFGIPDILVKQGAASINNNGSYDFGNVNMLSNSGDITFTIQNSGTATLTVDVASSTLTGANSGDFTVDLTNINSGNFKVKFTPSGSGVRTAQISIANNVMGKNPYVINLTGTGAKLNQAITFNPITDKRMDESPVNPGATASSGLAVTYTSSNTAVATGGSTVTLVGIGTTTITAKQAGNDNYNAATDKQQTLNVLKGNQTITFTALPEKTATDGSFDLTASASSGLSVSYASSNTSVATVSGNKVTIVGAGSTVITARQPGDANFFAADDVPQTLTVSKVTQSINFGALDAKTFGDGTFDLNATASSNLAITFTSSNTAVATVVGKTVTIVGAGSTIIKADQVGDSKYHAATAVEQTLTVNKANQTITFGALEGKIFGDAPFTISATGGISGLPVLFSSSNTSVATVATAGGTTTVTIVGAGSTVITASQDGNTNFNAATPIEHTLTVDKASQAISFAAISDKTFGDAAFSVSATGGASGLPVNFTSSNTNVATVATTSGTALVTIVGAGNATITAIQAGNNNYNAASNVGKTFTVNKASQSITFDALPAKIFKDGDFPLTATGGASGLPVTFSSSNTDVATIVGNNVHIVGGGTTTITASQAGNLNYQPAADVPQLFTVNKSGQSISFTPIPDKTLGTDQTINLVATASSDLAVSFTENSDKVTLSGNQVTILNAGRAIITASQAGNLNYSAAPSVEQSFCIKPAKPMITQNMANPEAPVLTSNSPTGNQWYLNGVTSVGTGTSITVTQEGTYTLKTKVDDCESEASSPVSFVVTGDLQGMQQSGFTVYPNPVVTEIRVRWNNANVNREREIVLLDMMGRKLNSKSGKMQEVIFDASSLSSGPYLIKGIEGGKIHFERIIKQ
jgi:ELWxxDGT repeat protein